ncbi:MAG TPA: hypothetical protein VF556_02030 [Pyrinomonadaceae bacterium]|jgi:hypothetical protein
MKKLLPLLILMFAFTANAQSLRDKINTFKYKNAYKVEYDKTQNRTLVEFGELPVNRTGGTEMRVKTVFIGASFSFEGEAVPDNVETFNLYFQSFCPRWCFLESHSLIFSAGNERIDLGNGSFNGVVGHGHGEDVTETMIYTISRAELEKIAKAGKSELQLGNFVSVLRDDHKQALKNMLELAICP